VRRAADETGVVVSVEEHSITGGLGSAVAEVLAESGGAVRFRRFGVPDALHHTIGSQTYLRQVCGSLEEVVRSLLPESRCRRKVKAIEAALAKMGRV
jgi:transketolase